MSAPRRNVTDPFYPFSSNLSIVAIIYMRVLYLGVLAGGGGCSTAASKNFRQNGYDSGKNTWNELLI